MSKPDRPFFVGYLAIPSGLKGYLIGLSLAFLAGFALTGILVGATQDNPGDGRIRGDYGRQTVTGIVELTSYPLLHVTQGTDRIAEGQTLMLTAGNKSGVMSRAAPLEGQLVTASGVILERGDLDMLQLRGGRQGIVVAEGTAELPPPEPLGRWKLAGEICDGKCLAGAMRPGRGLAHKACANLCLIGGVPPVFVTTQAVEGAEFLLITGPDGGELPKEAYDFVAQFVSLEGEITRHGDLLVLALDPDSIEVLE